MSALDEYLKAVGTDSSIEWDQSIDNLFRRLNEKDKEKIIKDYRKNAESMYHDHLKNNPNKNITDVYKAHRGESGKAAYSISQSDVTVNYNKNLPDAKKLDVLTKNANALESFEYGVFKQMASGINNGSYNIGVVAGYDSISEEKARVEQIKKEVRERIKESKQTVKDFDYKKEANTPPINKTKVEESRSTIKDTVETKNNKTKTPPPEKPQSKPDSKSKPKVKKSTSQKKAKTTNNDNHYDTKRISKFIKGNRGKIALGAIGAGLLGSMLDDEDDNIQSAAGKGVKAGAFGVGASFAGEYMFKSQTVQDLVKGEVSDVAKSIQKSVEAERRMVKVGSSLPIAARVGAVAVGAATILDVAQRMGDKLEANRMEKQNEKNLKQREKKKKARQKEQSYGYVDSGEIVFELFGKRTGHYKMGNAKFD